ncbi:unnamed protein product [Moneuplotes crassus]|uniref:WW domain-containing protein n=1 Tax=Euplotes crassus TaxID=5936 RepID=A0AAD1XZC3_EUPCR|nr:unnamed protein product [Moneuplotes crassus]
MPAVILEEEIANNYNPDDQEIIEYAEFLGMDINTDHEFFYIAKEGLKAPLPNPWKPVQDAEGELYFYNFESGEVIQEHPCDEYYKDLYHEEKAKKEQRIHERMIQEEQQRLAEEEDKIIQEIQPTYQPEYVNSQVSPVKNSQSNVNQDVIEFTENYNASARDQIEFEEEESEIPDINEYEDERIDKLNQIMEDLKQQQIEELSKAAKKENMDRVRNKVKKEYSVKLRQEMRKLQSKLDADLKEWRENLSTEDYKPDLNEDHQDLLQMIETKHKEEKESLEEKYEKYIDAEQLKAEKEADNIIDMAQGKVMDQSSLKDFQVTAQEKQQIHEKFEAEFASKLSKEKANLKAKYSKNTSEKQKLETQFARKENTKLKELEIAHLKDFRNLEKTNFDLLKKQKDEISKSTKLQEEAHHKEFTEKKNELSNKSQKRLADYKLEISRKIKAETSEIERKLSKNLQSQRKIQSSGNRAKDALKELNKRILDLENDKIRKKKEAKDTKDEVVQLQFQLDSINTRSSPVKDTNVRTLEEELDVKKRRLERLREMIHQQKAKTKTRGRSKKRATKIVEEITDAIDKISPPNRQVGVRFSANDNTYKNGLLEEPNIPINHRIEEIFDFTAKERDKVIAEKEKVKLEYKLISSLKDNLYKDNVSFRENLSMNIQGTRRGLLEIHSHLEDQSDALETERKDLNSQIEKCAKMEKVLEKIYSKKNIMKESTSCKLSTNISKEVSSDYEHYLRTYVLKVDKSKAEPDIFSKQIFQKSRDSRKNNFKTMYSGYKHEAPKYVNLSRLVDKVFPKNVLTNNFFSSMHPKTLTRGYSQGPGYGQSFIKKQKLSFH